MTVDDVWLEVSHFLPHSNPTIRAHDPTHAQRLDRDARLFELLGKRPGIQETDNSDFEYRGIEPCHNVNHEPLSSTHAQSINNVHYFDHDKRGYNGS